MSTIQKRYDPYIKCKDGICHGKLCVRRDRIRSDIIRRELDSFSINAKIAEIKLQWIYHISRKEVQEYLTSLW